MFGSYYQEPTVDSIYAAIQLVLPDMEPERILTASKAVHAEYKPYIEDLEDNASSSFALGMIL